jgi:hypothetical protein
MINQPWTTRNWFSYNPLQYKENKSNSGEMRFLPQNESVVFSLNNISNWSLSNPHRKIYNNAKGRGNSMRQRSYVEGVVELKVYMEHSAGIKLNTFWKYTDPETGVLTDQITPLFDAMKKARLM